MRGPLLAVLIAVFVVTAFPAHDQIAFKTSQGEPISVPSKFDKIGDNMKQWAQNGRDFIHRDGLTCESDHLALVRLRWRAHPFIR